ncbi:hypothetical protein C9374_005534 [Naegleria lovaniensis]|uniref:60S ribosomal protein L34 n=1 Tax=Naegleria lovaniensis TaxID=51637 RepID=A0AA88GPX5_NAELO|nr:uncharacterized protein C9374_005534 [Naegleria lovaniensis]KAG2382332.1 hypothetical protein C9374_005534 [Naegleria lovaniensis]
MSLDKRVTLRRKKTYGTRSNLKKMVKTPSGRLVVQFTKKKVNAPSVPKYLGGEAVRGLKRLRPSENKRAAMSDRTVSRAYGGVLNHNHLKERIVRAFLMEEKKIVKQVKKIKAQKDKQAESK